MNPSEGTGVALSLSASPIFLPLATSFVEKAAFAFGLQDEETLSLTLAAEEMFAYLCNAGAPKREVRVVCASEGAQVRTDFLFSPQDFNMRAFNLSTTPSLEEDTRLEETGLLIASRMVDRFKFSLKQDVLRVTLIKEKTYPDSAPTALPETPAMMTFAVKTPDIAETKTLMHLIAAKSDRHTVPSALRSAGKVVDLVSAGHVHAAIAVNDHDNIGGGMVWRRETPRMVECFGPYLFNQQAESPMAEALVDDCLNSIARSGFLGLINRYPTPELPTGYFELLGSLTYPHALEGTLERPAFFRHLQEDLGTSVWSHHTLTDFLRREYDRLEFAREIRISEHEGEHVSPYSVLSAEFDRAAQQVTLRPVWWGSDAEATLVGHVEVLKCEQIPLILFEMDLGRAWQCHFAPALSKCGFEPRFVLPYAGKRDLVIFQCMTA